MVSRKTMTIQIPDDLARGLEAIAAAQRKSVEQVALESLRSFFNKASSPEVILRAVRQMSHPSAAAVDERTGHPARFVRRKRRASIRTSGHCRSGWKRPGEWLRGRPGRSADAGLGNRDFADRARNPGSASLLLARRVSACLVFACLVF